MTQRDVARSVAAATLVDHPLRFIRYETVSLAGPRAVTYRLRGRGVSAVVRHGSRDVERLLDGFARRLYAVPAPARAELQALARPRVLDLGAGPGLTALSLLAQYPEAVVTSVEPDPMNVIILRRTIGANPRFGHWQEIVAAAGDGSYLRGPGYGRFGPKATEEGRHAEGAPLDAAPLIQAADLLALNLQGEEWSLLGDGALAQSEARVVFLEPHRRGCPEADPAGAASRLLAGAGFQVVRREKTGGSVVLCGWRARPAPTQE